MTRRVPALLFLAMLCVALFVEQAHAQYPARGRLSAASASAAQIAAAAIAATGWSSDGTTTSTTQAASISNVLTITPPAGDVAISLPTAKGIQWNGVANRILYADSTGILTYLSPAGTYYVGPYDTATGYLLDTKTLFSTVEPTIASGFGTGPSIAANGTASFRITVGTGGTDTAGVLTLPASTGPAARWNCWATDQSTPGLNVTKQSASGSATSVTLTNYVSSTGIATAWTAGDVVIGGCVPD